MKPSSRKKWPYPYEEQLLATGNRLCQNRLFKTHNHQNPPSKNKSLKSGHFGSWAWNAHTYFTWLLLCCGHAFLTYQPSQSISFRGELTHSQAQGEERACQNLRGGLATVPQDSSESSLLPAQVNDGRGSCGKWEDGLGELWKNFKQGEDMPTILIMAIMPPSLLECGVWGAYPRI